jgi:flagellar motor switch/type III secretory pathway protein FliN
MDEQQLARYSQIPLTVEAELGRRTLTVREILSLSTGSVMRLPIPVGSKVAVVVGGAPFGVGDIMRRGKAVAVRISNFPGSEGKS